MLCVFSSELQSKNYRFDLLITLKQHKIPLGSPLCAFKIPPPCQSYHCFALSGRAIFWLPLRLWTAQQFMGKALAKQRLELPWLINEILLLKMAYFTACCELSFETSQATGRSSWAAFEGSVVWWIEHTALAFLPSSAWRLNLLFPRYSVCAWILPFIK